MEKILVIEDETTTRNIFLECLDAEGFATFSAENGRIGLQQAQEQLPDLVICDILMPELDGYAVLTTLRQDPITALIPFIFLTAKATRAELRRGMELGADDYLTKPLTAEELLRAIVVLLEKQATRRHFYATQYQTVAETRSTHSSTNSYSFFPCCPQLTEVFQFIEANYDQAITLNDVAQAVGYSSAYLTDLVRRQTGQPVHRWIIKRRMAAACTLLLETDQTVNRIAEEIGYETLGHFNRQFRQLYGMTPKTWRDSHRSNHPA